MLDVEMAFPLLDISNGNK